MAGDPLENRVQVKPGRRLRTVPEPDRTVELLVLVHVTAFRLQHLRELCCGDEVHPSLLARGAFSELPTASAKPASSRSNTDTDHPITVESRPTMLIPLRLGRETGSTEAHSPFSCARTCLRARGAPGRQA